MGSSTPRPGLFISSLPPDAQECALKVQDGKFKLQDLLVVPMQRVLKYHLLLKVRPRSQPLRTGQGRAASQAWAGAPRRARLRRKRADN